MSIEITKIYTRYGFPDFDRDTSAIRAYSFVEDPEVGDEIPAYQEVNPGEPDLIATQLADDKVEVALGFPAGVKINNFGEQVPAFRIVEILATLKSSGKPFLFNQKAGPNEDGGLVIIKNTGGDAPVPFDFVDFDEHEPYPLVMN